MSIEFAVGKRVVCIHGPWLPPHFASNVGTGPEIGGIYTIREILDAKWRPGELAFLLEEIRRQPEECILPNGSTIIIEVSFYAFRFRPVRETSIDCFTKLLEKQPELVGGNA